MSELNAWTNPLFRLEQRYDFACDEIEHLTRQLKIMTLKASGSLANNLCPDHRDKQAGKSCLACEIERLRKALEEHAKFKYTFAGYIDGYAKDLTDTPCNRGSRPVYFREAAGSASSASDKQDTSA